MENERLTLIDKESAPRKRRKRPEQSVNLSPGDGGLFVGSAIELMKLPKIDIDDVPAVQKRIEDYFGFCAKRDLKPSVAGVALALDINRRELLKYAQDGIKSDELRLTLKKAFEILDFLMDQYMQNGKINPVSGIFLMKNNLGYSDTQKVEISAPNPFGAAQDRKSLEERYLESVPDIIDSPTD